ncbi:hypothetical protein FSST1_010269 [Fusarium sambucinum]
MEMEKIPVSWSDQPNPIPNLRTRTFFITDHPLDEEVLKDGLESLIKNHWQKLGAGLVLSEKQGLEYHLPHVFSDGYEIFRWSSVSAGYSYGETHEMSKIVHPGDSITFLPAMDRIDKLARPQDWPFESKDDPPNSPLLFIHLTKFSDGAILAISVPLVLADQGGVANIVKAWLSVIDGKTPPEMVGLKEDVLGSERLSNVKVEQKDRIGRMRIRSKKDQALVVGRILLDMAKEKKEKSHVIFLPLRVVSNLREKVKKSLEGKHIPADEISNGDIITAIFTKLARRSLKSEYTVSLSSTINLRDRIPELKGEKGEGFIHNAVHYATANFAVNPSTPLSEIALQSRIAVNKALGQEDIQAGVKTLPEVAKSGQLMLISAPESYDKTSYRKEMVVLGESKSRNALGRYRVVIMCRTSEGFSCDFAAPIKTMAMINEFIRRDPTLKSMLEKADAEKKP